MPDFTFLVKAEISQSCFLSEVLYWRAFGRIPQDMRDDYGNPHRNDFQISDDGVFAPIPYLEYITDEECSFAGLSPDPRMHALLTERPSSELSYYEKIIGIIKGTDPSNRLESGPYSLATIEPFSLATIEAEFEEAKKYQVEVEEWLPNLQDCLDQFKSEICLDLRRGNLSAKGRKLSHPKIEDAKAALSGNCWFDSIAPSTIPPEAWVTKDINWEGSAIVGRNATFIWIQIDVAEMLQRYPPTSIAKPDKLIAAGATFALSSLPPSSRNSPSNRGRPPLPWASFHVEVARLYKIGEMPEKKEAAIAQLQDWFFQQHRKQTSRSAVGHKLKPYFDALGKK